MAYIIIMYGCDLSSTIRVKIRSLCGPRGRLACGLPPLAQGGHFFRALPDHCACVLLWGGARISFMLCSAARQDARAARVKTLPALSVRRTSPRRRFPPTPTGREKGNHARGSDHEINVRSISGRLEVTSEFPFGGSPFPGQ